MVTPLDDVHETGMVCGSVEAEKWNYVAAVHNWNTGQLSLYIDAVKAGVTEYGQIELATQEASLTIGAIGEDPGFSGRIACPRIYDHGLSDEEVNAYWTCVRSKCEETCGPLYWHGLTLWPLGDLNKILDK